MTVLGSIEIKTETLPSVPLDLTPADVAVIQPALHLALSRIEEQRMVGAAGFAFDESVGAFAGRRFSVEMYARMRAVHDRLGGPGPIEADDFELRIMAFIARIGRRYLSHPFQVPADLEDRLDTSWKRAKRRALAAIGKEQYRELAQVWDGFRQWCKFYLFESPKLKAKKRRAARPAVDSNAQARTDKAKRPIDSLLEIADDVINPESKLAADPQRLRTELYSFLTEVKRGRWGIDIDDFRQDRHAAKDALVRFLRRRDLGWDLRREFMDLSIQMSTDATRARQLMARFDVDEPEPAAEAAGCTVAPAVTIRPQPNVTRPVLTTPHTAAASGAAPQPSPAQPEPSQTELLLLFANWLINDVLPENRFTVFKEVLTRLHRREDLPQSANRFGFADCRPTQRADRVKFYTDWVLAWLLSWTSDMAKAQTVIGMGLECARHRWISMPVIERERIVAEIHLRHFQ